MQTTDAQPIKTLLFDFGGTLDADGVAWKERIHALYRAEGLDMADAEFAPLFYAADDALAESLPREADLATTVHRLTANLEGELARHEGGSARNHGDARRGRRVAASFLADSSAAIARNKPILAALNDRYRLGIVANFYGNLEAVCRAAGLAPLFATMIDSRRVGAEKPAPAIFRAALAQLGATPQTTLFVGDSLRRDREGARRMGMRFVWIAPPAVQAAEARVAQGPLDHPIVAQLQDLAEILP